MTPEAEASIGARIAEVGQGHPDGVPQPEIVSRETLDRLLPRGAVHQGVGALVAGLDDTDIDDICRAVEGQSTARIVVLGDSDVIGNGLLTEGPGNTTFAVNCLRWLVGDDARLSVVGRPQAVRRLTLSSDDLAALRWVVIGLGPMLAVILGAAVWTTRRGR